MSDRNALVLVDAGFLIKALLLHVGKTSREQVAIDYEALTEVLFNLAEEETASRVIRQTWYDAARGAQPRPEHRVLAGVPGVHVRLGWTVAVDHGPQQRLIQKAVDTTIVRDIIMAAVHQTADDLVLIASDGDLVPGLREAVDRGVRIHLWGVSLDDERVQQSEELIALADRRLTLDPADLSLHVRTREEGATPAAPGEAAPAPSSVAPVVSVPGLEAGIAAGTQPSDEATTEGHVLRPSPRPLTEAKVGPPTLRQLSPREDHGQDVTEDLVALPDLTPHGLGDQYGYQWWTRAGDKERDRLIKVARRPGLPWLVDSDLIGYARARWFNTADEQVRRDLRAGFWSGVDRART